MQALDRSRAHFSEMGTSVGTDRDAALRHSPVLGPPEMPVYGVPRPIGGRTSGRVVALPLINAGRPTPIDRIVYVPWKDQVSSAASRTVYYPAHGLRRVLPGRSSTPAQAGRSSTSGRPKSTLQGRCSTELGIGSSRRVTPCNGRSRGRWIPLPASHSTASLPAPRSGGRRSPPVRTPPGVPGRGPSQAVASACARYAASGRPSWTCCGSWPTGIRTTRPLGSWARRTAPSRNSSSVMPAKCS
jgi:hypothetical protein